MFVCDDCLKRYKNMTNYLKSYGPCEFCGKVKSCSDIPSCYLEEKEKESKKDEKY